MNEANIKLDVPLFKQKSKDMACGFVCLQMVLAYYGKNLNYNGIIKLAKLDPYIGCWWTQMANAALDLGFKTELVNYNISNIYDSDITGLKGEVLIKRLQKQKRKIDELYYSEIKYDTEMIKKGGKLSLRIPTKTDIISWLRKGIPPILSVKVGPAYGEVPTKKRKDILDQHGIVIYGYDGKNFLVRDPYSGKDAIKKLSENLSIYSWYEAKAYALLISK